MTFRERLADWISGGALSYARKDVIDRQNAYSRAMDGWESCSKEADKYHEALLNIRAEGRKSANSTAQYVCRIAEEALGE